jgi:hypothetical protein
MIFVTGARQQAQCTICLFVFILNTCVDRIDRRGPYRIRQPRRRFGRRCIFFRLFYFFIGFLLTFGHDKLPEINDNVVYRSISDSHNVRPNYPL